MLPKVPVGTAVSRGGTLIGNKTVKNGQPVYTFDIHMQAKKRCSSRSEERNA